MAKGTTMEWQGADSLKKLLVPIESLKEHPENPRRGSVTRIAESLRANGQYRPIVVQKSTQYILGGNHTKQAAESLGWSHIAVVEIECDEIKARQILLADNRTGDLATYDDAALVDLLAGLNDDGVLDGTGWTPDEAEDLMAELDMTATTPLEEFTGGYAETEEEYEERAKPSPVGSVEPLREVVLMYRQLEYQLFGKWVSHLEKVYGTRGSVATVFETIKRAAVGEGYSGPVDTEEEAAQTPEADAA